MCPLNSAIARRSLTFMWTTIGLLEWCLWNLANCKNCRNLANYETKETWPPTTISRMHPSIAWQLLNAQSIRKQIGWTYSANGILEHKPLTSSYFDSLNVRGWPSQMSTSTLQSDNTKAPKQRCTLQSKDTEAPKHESSNTKASKRIYRSIKP
jgi:hypothetical protein